MSDIRKFYERDVSPLVVSPNFILRNYRTKVSKAGRSLLRSNAEDLNIFLVSFPQGMRLIWLAIGIWDSINALMFQQTEVSTVPIDSATESRAILVTHVAVLSISAMDLELVRDLNGTVSQPMHTWG